MERLLLRVDEAAEVAGISRSKAYELIASGAWPKVIVGKSVRVPLVGLREWVERETVPGIAHDGTMGVSARHTLAETR